MSFFISLLFTLTFKNLAKFKSSLLPLIKNQVLIIELSDFPSLEKKLKTQLVFKTQRFSVHIIHARRQYITIESFENLCKSIVN